MTKLQRCRRMARICANSALLLPVVLIGTATPALAADTTIARSTGLFTAAAAVFALVIAAAVLAVLQVVGRLVAVALRALMFFTALRLLFWPFVVTALVLMVLTYAHH
jgi:hypothetical protein